MAPFSFHVVRASLPLFASAALHPSPFAQPQSVLEQSGEDRYESAFDQLRKMAPRADRVATVRNLTLRRDVIEFRLEQGRLSLLTPVADRTVGAVFVGQGSVSFAPPLDVERAQLQRVLGDTILDAR